MTDQQHDLEVEAALLEGHAAPEGEAHAETWQDGQQPYDDFHDNSAESAPVEGDGADRKNDETHSDAEENAEAAPKKSGSKVFLSVLVAGALFAGGLAYLQFGGSNNDKQQTAPAFPMMNAGNSWNGTMPGGVPETAQNGIPGGVVAPVAKTAEAPVTPTTAQADLSALYGTTVHEQGSVTNGTVYPSAADNQIQGGQIQGGNAKDALQPAVVPAVSPVAPVAQVAPAVVPSPQPTAATTANPPPSSGAVSGTADARLAALAAQVSNLQKTVQNAQTGMVSPSTAANPALEDRLGRIEKQLSDMAQRAPGENAVNPAVDARLTHIEQELESLSSRKTSKTTGTSLADNYRQPTAARHASSRHANKNAAAHGHVKKAASVKPVKAAEPAAETWVLRAATPGVAWVAKDATSTDLRRVREGDALPGIGTVRSISQNGDSWVVVGSNGTIR